MQPDQMRQSIERIEECVDEAQRAVSAGSAPPELRQCVEQMHQQAQQAKQQCASTGNQQQMGQGQDSLRQAVQQLEQSGDRAVQVCRSAGQVDPKTQQAVQRAHDQISQLKKQMQMG